MALAALANPQTIKVSSKRQITIPAQWYKEMNFGDYALCTWTEQGILLQPLDVDDEDVTIDILRHLINNGYEGEALIEEYQALKGKIVPIKNRIKQAENDAAEGRTDTYERMRMRIRDEYGF